MDSKIQIIKLTINIKLFIYFLILFKFFFADSIVAELIDCRVDCWQINNCRIELVELIDAEMIWSLNSLNEWRNMAFYIIIQLLTVVFNTVTPLKNDS